MESMSKISTRALLVLPLAALMVFLIIGYSSSSSSFSSSSSSSVSKSTLNADMTFSACTNTYNDKGFDCIDDGMPVLSGYDVVSYFTDSQPSLGLESFKQEYKGHTYFFSSQANKDTFIKDPNSYVPSYGSFCSWGVSTETMPDYPWDFDCLGPNVNPLTYAVLPDTTTSKPRLFFFLSDTPKQKFMSDPKTYMAAGDARWNGWYEKDASILPMNTKCFNQAETA
jgi:YHS domain-containing protein